LGRNRNLADWMCNHPIDRISICSDDETKSDP
jgi:hypothetical protein